MDEGVTIELSGEEALVLFEFLSRYSDEKKLEIVDQAEQRVLWDLCCILERQLVAPFKAEYADLLSRAREHVRDAED